MPDLPLTPHVDAIRRQVSFATLAAELQLTPDRLVGEAASQAVVLAGAVVSGLLWPAEPARRPGASPDEVADHRSAVRDRGRRLREVLNANGLAALRSTAVRDGLRTCVEVVPTEVADAVLTDLVVLGQQADLWDGTG